MRTGNFTLVFFVLFIGMAIFSFAAPLDAAIAEPLLGLELNADAGSIRITVAQCGGTQKNSFRFDVQKNGNEQFLTVLRIQKDECKMMPQRETFDFSLIEIGIDARKSVFVTNSFVGDEMFADMIQHDLENKAIEPKEEGKTAAPATLREKAEAVFKGIGVR
ncbi:MAG: hypothetical protein KKB51_21895 [Candidatus Riflebacteria bacterium]|nr:hypothetical protein [Candidatus Riflebacteria bacterium]